jgi:hypothetical protein
MTYEVAVQSWEEISDSKPSVLREQMAHAAVAYARIRTDWQLASREERLEMDPRRTSAHNAFIDACNILSRAMVQAGESPDWRKRLGDDRATIGDFACWIHCLLGIAAR